MKKLRNVRIEIDPGHGGRDPGTIARKRNFDEDEINLMIAKKLVKELRNNGAIVLTTRGKLAEDDEILRSKRAETANNDQADIFVSVHCNAAVKKIKKDKGKKVDNPHPRGAEVYFYQDPKKKRAIASEKLANYIMTKLETIKGLKSRGVKEKGFTVLVDTHVPAVLVETAFMTNPADEKLLNKESFRKKVAEAICEGIIEYFKNVNNKIVDLKYNPPGKRDRNKLNEEYVEIKNVGEELQDFAGWTLEDKAGHKFYFTSRREGKISWCSVLKAGESMKVYTGSGTNERYGTKRYFNYRMPIWNNLEEDKATLRDNTGKVIAQYTYKITKAPHRKLKEPKTLIRNNKTKETHLSGKDACYWVGLIRDASTIMGTVPTCYFCAAWYEKKIEITYKWLEGETWREEKKGPFYEKWEE